jgi:hypothetical protein
MAEVTIALPRCIPFFSVPARLSFELLELVGGEDDLDLPENILDVPEMAVERPEQRTRGGAYDEVGPDPPLLERLDHPEMAEPRGRSSGEDVDHFRGVPVEAAVRTDPFNITWHDKAPWTDCNYT